MSQRILFLGAGKMGSAILKGLLQGGASPQDLAILEPHQATRDAIVAETGVRSFDQRQPALQWADLIILAVKPQIWKELGPQISKDLDRLPKKIFVSIMAGISLTSLSQALLDQDVVRTMPNLPLTVSQGAVGYCLPSNGDHLSAVVENLFHGIGLTVKISESQMDALTGLSGSGPAYVFQILEGLIQGGVLCGLTRAQSEDLSYQTLKGSLELWRQSGKALGALTAEVCSPGGTTIAGVQVLEDRSLRGTLMQAVQAAAKRSGELG